MAQNLADMLTPGEKVVFRSGYSFRETVLWTSLPSTVLLLGLVFWFDEPLGLSAIWSVVAWLFFFAIARVRYQTIPEVAVTNYRVINRSGVWKKKLDEVRLKDIKHIELTERETGASAPLTIELLNGDTIIWVHIERAAKVHDAIALQCGLPRWPSADKIVTVCIAVSSMIGILVGGALMFWAGLEYADFVEGQNTELTGVYLIASIAAIPLIMMSSFVGGLLLAFIVVSFVLRFILTPDQAKQLACTGYRMAGSGWYVRSIRWYCGLSARYVSWLYG